MVTAQHTEDASSAQDSTAVPPGIRVYAIGDIHGRADLLAFLLRRVQTDAENAPERRIFVFLGDVIDRGLQSSDVIDLLTRPLPSGFESVFLKGNHEDMMMRFLKGDTAAGLDWVRNGGAETLESYGVAAPEWSADAATYDATATALAVALPADHRAYFQNLRMTYRQGDYLFVHAGLRPGVALEDQSDHDLMWIRPPQMERKADAGPVVVHGHSIVDKPDVQSRRIGIDTGAYASNVLTCLVLEGTNRRFLSTSGR